MIRLIISGYLGKMGAAMCDAVRGSKSICIVAGVDKAFAGGKFDVPVYSDISDVAEEADGVVDFSRPEAVYGILKYCKEKSQGKKKVFAIIGTTALTDKERQCIDSAAPYVPIFSSGNMSLGVNLQLKLAASAASTLGGTFDIEIVETHHNRKVDSPSGTALMLAEAVNAKLSKKRVCKYGRYTKTEARSKNEIGIHSVRGGTVVGEHNVMFMGNDEMIEIVHHAYSKQIFAQGALRAAEFMADKQPGIYNMQDIVRESECTSDVFVTTGQAVVRITGLATAHASLHQIFDTLGEHGIAVDMVSLARHGEISFSLRKEKLIAAVALIAPYFSDSATITDIPDVSKITVECASPKQLCSATASIFLALENNNIESLILTSSDNKISVGIAADHVETALCAIEESLGIAND